MPLEKNILDLAQRQRTPDVHHHREANNLGRRVKISEWVSHPTRLKNGFVCLKPFCSDIAGLDPHCRIGRIHKVLIGRRYFETWQSNAENTPYRFREKLLALSRASPGCSGQSAGRYTASPPITCNIARCKSLFFIIGILIEDREWGFNSDPLD